MTMTACTYAPLRFLPYKETGEFVNVGVVVCAPKTGFFSYKISQRIARITGFFPELDKKIFKSVRAGVMLHLDAIEKDEQLKQLLGTHDPENLLARFREIVRVREGLLSFGPVGALIAESPEQAVRTLYDRMVLRQFAHKQEYKETVLRRRLAGCLRTWGLDNHYKELELGDDRFHVKVPFAHQNAQGDVTKVLRQLDLDKREPTEIYRHGDQWIINLRRLKEFGNLPNDVVFAYEVSADGDRAKAGQAVLRELRQIGATPIPLNDPDQLQRSLNIG